MDLSEFIQDRAADILAQWESTEPKPAPGTGPARRQHGIKLLQTLSIEMQRRRLIAGGERAASPAAARFWPAAAVISREYAGLRAAVLGAWERARPEPTAQDVRDMREFDAALDDAVAELTATFSPIGEAGLFLGVLEHELRNAVTGISMSVKIQLRDLAPSSPTGRAAERIGRNCAHLQQTLEALDVYSQANLLRGLPISPEAADLEILSRDVARRFAVADPGHPLRLETRGNLRGTWDADRLVQGIEALLLNAAKIARRDSGIALVVNGYPRDTVRISVESSGTPIDADSFMEIFHPHLRRDTSQSTYAGLGLGLFVAREVFESHNGKIDVVVAEGRGTTITVDLPRS